MTYQVGWLRQVVRRLLRLVFRQIFRLLFRLEFHGWEHVPPQGPYLVVYNHVSVLDPPILLAFWPYPIEAVAAVEVFRRPGQNVLVKLYGAIPVRRGEVDRRLLSTLEEVLRSGRALLLAPEGTRSHVPGMQRAWTGVAYLLERVPVPVVPVGVVGGTDEALRQALRFRRPKITVRIGEPFTLPELSQPGMPRKAVRRAETDYIMRRLASLLPPEYRGVYGDDATAAAEAGQ